MTPCAADGKIFVLGSTLRLYGLDAKTGKMLWETDLGGKHHYLEQLKADGIAQKKLMGWNRDNNGAPIYVDGVVVVSDFNKSASILGFDPNTGRQLWKVKGYGGAQSVQATWTHEGKTYVIASGLDDHDHHTNTDGFACIDPQDGRVLWRKDLPRAHGFARSFTVHENYLLLPSKPGKAGQDYQMKERRVLEKKAELRELMSVRGRSNKPERINKLKKEIEHLDHIRKESIDDVTIACYDLALRGKHMWSTFTDRHYFSSGLVITYKGEVILNTAKSFTWVDLKTGAVTHRLEGRGAVSMPIISGNRALIEVDGTHSNTQYIMIDLDKKVLMGPIWSPAHHQTTSYAHDQCKPFAEGRMYFRGFDKLVAYDMRKIMQVHRDAITGGLVTCRATVDYLKEPDLVYTWIFSDGTVKKGPKATHRFKQPKDHEVITETVQLVITSSNGMRRTAEKKIRLTGALIQAVESGKTEPGVVIDYHRIKTHHLKFKPKDIEQRQPEEQWLYPTPNIDMTIKTPEKQRGAVKIHGYFQVPEDGFYYFTPSRNGYGGAVESGMPLFIGDRSALKANGTKKILPLQAGLHPFSLILGIHPDITSKSVTLLLTPAHLPNVFSPVPTDALFRPAVVQGARKWTGKRPPAPGKAVDEDADQDDEDMLDDLEDGLFD